MLWAGRPYVLNPTVVVKIDGDVAALNLSLFGHSLGARSDLAAWLSKFDRAFDIDILQIFDGRVAELLADNFIILPEADSHALGGGLTRAALRPVGPVVGARELRQLRPGGACVFGVPLDTARVPPYSPFHGPDCIRKAIAERHHPHIADYWIDLGDIVNWPQDALPDIGTRARYLTGRVLAAGRTPFILGGDHTTTFFALLAVAERYTSYSVVQLDAHHDISGIRGPNSSSPPLNHATVMDHVLQLAGLSELVQIGVRQKETHNPVGVLVLPRVSAKTPSELRSRSSIEELVESLPVGPMYVSIDLDVLDPIWAPEVTTPSRGGLSPEEVLSIVKGLASSRELIGLDLVEVCAVQTSQNHAADYAAMFAEEIATILLRRDTAQHPEESGDVD